MWVHIFFPTAVSTVKNVQINRQQQTKKLNFYSTSQSVNVNPICNMQFKQRLHLRIQMQNRNKFLLKY
jgi:hypothetical protein